MHDDPALLEEAERGPGRPGCPRRPKTWTLGAGAAGMQRIVALSGPSVGWLRANGPSAAFQQDDGVGRYHRGRR